MTTAILIQGIGLAGMVCGLLSFQQNKRHLMLWYLILAQVIFTLHFGLLQAWTAVAVNSLALLRGVIFYYKRDHTWAHFWLWPYLFIGVFCLMGYFTWDGPRSLLVVVASILETIGLWRNQPKQIRWFLLAVRPLFFTYAVLIGSYAGMLADVIFSISLIIGMVRFDRKQLPKLPSF